MNKIAIIQGRLSPRIDNQYQFFPWLFWKEEFFKAKEFSFDAIEFIYDNTTINPLNSIEGINEIKRLINESGVKVFSICADYFMNNHLHSPDRETRAKNRTVLNKLCIACNQLDIKYITLPLLEISSLKTREDIFNLKDSLLQCIPIIWQNRVNICLELDLPPEDVKKLLTDLDFSCIKVTYDSGNSACLNYNVIEELKAYGDRIGVVHLKDRTVLGGPVLLGEGNAEFHKLFQELENLDFKGLLVLQGVRGNNPIEDLHLVIKQLDYIRGFTWRFK